MNETLIFKENGKMYLCRRASYVTGGFRYPEIWEECEPPNELKDTQPRGAGVIQNYNDKTYMLYNTAGEASGKWFVYASEGIRFEDPGKIPEGIKEGLDFIIKRFPDRSIKIGRHIYEKSVSIVAKYSKLDVYDFKVKENIFAEKFDHYEEMRKFFALDLYDKIILTVLINKGDENYNKYADKNKEINIDDILNDLNGNWEYIGGIGEIIFW